MHSVTRATTIVRLVYAIPSWWGITAEKDRAKIERLYNRLKRMGYLPMGDLGIPALFYQAKASLYQSIHQNPAHVLRHLLPPTVQHVYGLCPRLHNYVLPLRPLRMTKTLYLAICIN